MKIMLDVQDDKTDFALEFFKSISFIKKSKAIPKNEITNLLILKSIEDYESKKINSTPLSLKELKKFLNV